MRHRKLLLSAALAAATAGTALTAAPAQAATNQYTKDGCSVTALAPYFVSIASNGQKRVRFKLTFDCDAGRSIKFKQNGYDSDVGEGSATDTLLTKSYGPSSGTGGTIVTDARNICSGAIATLAKVAAAATTPQPVTSHSGSAQGSGRYFVRPVRLPPTDTPSAASTPPASSIGRPSHDDVVPSRRP